MTQSVLRNENWRGADMARCCMGNPRCWHLAQRGASRTGTPKAESPKKAKIPTERPYSGTRNAKLSAIPLQRPHAVQHTV